MKNSIRQILKIQLKACPVVEQMEDRILMFEEKVDVIEKSGDEKEKRMNRICKNSGISLQNQIYKS
jgi:hypothetical protein